MMLGRPHSLAECFGEWKNLAFIGSQNLDYPVFSLVTVLTVLS
jgi:hypothetical protein